MEKMRHLRACVDRVPFIEKLDLRYNNRVLKKRPQAQAVMFCLMDVSGSMDESRKDLAKRFFMLLYLFLKRNYERIDVVFIRHHTVAEEVRGRLLPFARIGRHGGVQRAEADGRGDSRPLSGEPVEHLLRAGLRRR